MTAPVYPSYDTPVGPPPTYPWAQRPPTGGPPPTALGGWRRGGDDAPELPPVVALLYSYHVKQLQTQPGFRAAEALENSLLEKLNLIHKLDYTGLLELELQLRAHADALQQQLAYESALQKLQPTDVMEKMEFETLQKTTERLFLLGRTLREYIAAKIVVR